MRGSLLGTDQALYSWFSSKHAHSSLKIYNRKDRARGLHSLTSELNLRTFGNASLKLELNLSTLGTPQRFNVGDMGDKVSLT